DRARGGPARAGQASGHAQLPGAAHSRERRAGRLAAGSGRRAGTAQAGRAAVGDQFPLAGGSRGEAVHPRPLRTRAEQSSRTASAGGAGAVGGNRQGAIPVRGRAGRQSAVTLGGAARGREAAAGGRRVKLISTVICALLLVAAVASALGVV